jgi:hypothetical protein
VAVVWTGATAHVNEADAQSDMILREGERERSLQKLSLFHL